MQMVSDKDNRDLPDFFTGTIEEIFIRLVTGFTAIPAFDKLTIVSIETKKRYSDNLVLYRGGLIAMQCDVAILAFGNGIKLIRNVITVSTRGE